MRTAFRRLTGAVVAVAAIVLISCRAERVPPPPDTQAAVAPRADTTRPETPPAATVAPVQFRTLKWIEGRWRGRDSAQLVFYEEYRFVDDSTIAMRSFADSTFARATDSSTIALRQGRVENVSPGATWVATVLNGNSVHFAPARGALNRFIWERASDGWTARLFPPDGSGGTGQRIYRMTPISR